MTVVTASDGTQFCVPQNPPKGCPQIPIPNTVFNDPNCQRFPITPKTAIDPNDKIGTVGVGDSRFVPEASPLNYGIHFENLATATGAAQVVVVTDQLDRSMMDLSTFQLGPISFGQVTLVPERGLQAFTGGVDLRPDLDLLLTVNAGLDNSTGVVTWRFTSIDPGTGQLTQSDAGFLPPNTTPPAGEGSVMFQVTPKSALATGTTIQNRASVIFDTNAPIMTPTWLNTIDKDAPVTHVLPLPATQSSPTFTVQWAGGDVGSGIATYAVYVSDNGRPFIPWLDRTVGLSATYSGQTGHTYGFFALGTDLVGNVEFSKTAAEATTSIGTTAVCAMNVGNDVQVARSGYGYNFTTGRFIQTVTLKNTGSTIIAGPIALVVDSLSSNATLYNPGGMTSCAAPAGSPFINWASDLAPAASASIVLQFTNPTRAAITYVPRVLAGTAGR
jgi:hypothetical protein